jgi:DNA-binding CsgD family transcriptional regulator
LLPGEFVVADMNDSPPREGPADLFSSQVLSLGSVIDDASLDERRWPAVAAQLAGLLPSGPGEIPDTFPSPHEADRLSQSIAKQPWSPEQATLVRFVCSRLVHGAKIRSELAISRLKSRAAVRALDDTPRAIVFVDCAATVWMTNASANDIISQADGLCVIRGQLRATSSNDDSKLRQSLDLVSRKKFKWVALSFYREKSITELKLVLTASNTLRRFEDHDDLILVTISNRGRKLDLDPDVLSRCYGLTRCEANFACCLGWGDTVEQAAERLLISSNTARTHLKRVFMKTGTNRQSELVLLLMQHTRVNQNSAPQQHRLAVTPGLEGGAENRRMLSMPTLFSLANRRGANGEPPNLWTKPAMS